MKFTRKVLSKIHHWIYNPRRVRLIAEVESRLPIYSQFIAMLTNGNAIGVKGYPWRALDQLKVLELVKPKSIVDLGSGTSTGVFGAYVHENEGSSLLSLDESEEWADLTRRGLEDVGLTPHNRIELRAVARRESDRGSYYDTTLEDNIDLLYVDGPSVLVRYGVKTANQDVLFHFDAGYRPAVIMVDGRIETVEAIRAHAASADYRFTPSMSYLYKAERIGLSDLAAFGAYHRHSIFLRNGKGREV